GAMHSSWPRSPSPLLKNDRLPMQMPIAVTTPSKSAILFCSILRILLCPPIAPVAPRSFCPALVAPTPLPSRCRLSHSVLNFHPPGRSILCSMSIDSNPTTLHQHHSDNGHQQNHHLCLSMARNSTLSRLSWSTEDTTTAESTFFNGKDGHGRIGHGHQRASYHTAR